MREQISINDPRMLGRLFGIEEDPIAAVPLSPMERFSSSTPLQKLIEANAAYRDALPEASLMRTSAVVDVLQTDPAERITQGIRIVSFVPLNEEGQLEVDTIANYNIYNVFPTENGSRYISVSRMAIHNLLRENTKRYCQDTLDYIDSLVANNSELYPESFGDRNNRLVSEIKLVDGSIKDLKGETGGTARRRGEYNTLEAVRNRVVSTEADELNSLKESKVLNYLQSGDEISELFPHLKSLYEVHDGSVFDAIHRELVLHYINSENLNTRLQHPRKPSMPVGDRGSVTTELNVRSLRMKRNAYQDDPTRVDLKTAHDLYERLGL